MNKLALFGCLSSLVFSAVAEVHEVAVGSVGVTAVSSSLKNTIVAISFADLENGGEIKVADLVKTDNLTQGDQLAVFNGNTYDTWTLQDGAWEKNVQTFTLGDDGLFVGTGADAALTTKTVGSGIWLIRNNDYAEGTPFTFYVFGKPVASHTSSVEPKTVALIGNPKQTSVELTAEKVAGIVNGDRIHVPHVDGFKVYTYVDNKNGRGWSTYDVGYKFANPNIPAGMGFWYLSSGENNITITW